MKFCNQCGSKNTANAKFCQECGNSLQNLVAAGAGLAIPAAAVTYGVGSGSSPLLNLSLCIAPARSRLKELRQTIPPASSDAIAPLMGRLQTILPDDITARIELIEALGRTRDPVVLRALLLVAGAGSKHVRRAVAVALSGINHTLSAYILLPMLEANPDAAVHAITTTYPAGGGFRRRAVVRISPRLDIDVRTMAPADIMELVRETLIATGGLEYVDTYAQAVKGARRPDADA